MGDVSLRRIDPEKNMARFYAVGIEPTLFGEWAVVRNWGRIGARGRSLETWFSEHAPALACADRFEAAKRRRGYREAGC
jgi:predicted DNA-binding WGR domain protein